MFWDGERWLPDDGQPIAQPQPRSRRRFRNSISAGIISLALVGLTLPMTGVLASTPSARTLLATWSASSKVTVYQESSRQISYHGRWVTARNAGYLGGKARAARAGKASATLKFSGAAVSWVGPVGPTRGKARVYVDGKLVKTVNTWASRFSSTRVLFQKSWSAVGAHTISIVAMGTARHPTVAIDAFLVRVDTGSTSVAAAHIGKGTARPKPRVTPTPTPKVAAAPTPTPKVAAAPTPTPKVAAAPTPAPRRPRRRPRRRPPPRPRPRRRPPPRPRPRRRPPPRPRPRRRPPPRPRPRRRPPPRPRPRRRPPPRPRPRRRPPPRPRPRRRAPRGSRCRPRSMPPAPPT